MKMYIIHEEVEATEGSMGGVGDILGGNIIKVVQHKETALEVCNARYNHVRNTSQWDTLDWTYTEVEVGFAQPIIEEASC